MYDLTCLKRLFREDWTYCPTKRFFSFFFLCFIFSFFNMGPLNFSPFNGACSYYALIVEWVEAVLYSLNDEA